MILDSRLKTIGIEIKEDDPKVKYSCGCKRTKGYKIYKAYQDLSNSDNPNDFLSELLSLI